MTMQKVIYGALAKVFAVVLVLVGAGALIGGNFAHSFITGQLGQEKISMPSQEGIDALSDTESQEILSKWIDQPLTTGPQAKAFADNYIYQHMMAASDGRTYEEVSGEYTKLSKDENADADEVASLGQLRQTLFMGDTLRGMLLNAYGWWLIGSIAIYVGVGAIIGGVILAVLGWGVFRTKKPAVEPAAGAPATE